nr:hypothetical protein [Tanacetum cinerariifolium]
MHFHLIVKDKRTMDMTIDHQVALDEALVPHASRLRIGKSNFRLKSDITSKESTLPVVIWATATVHHHSIRFKMNNKKRIVNLEYFKEMLHICPGNPNQTFDELPFEEETLAFMRNLGHNAKKSNDMYYPRFKKVIINFFMTKDPSIPKRNKVNWHYIRDNQMFTTIKLVSRHQNTQQFGAMLPVELTNEDIKNSAAYKEYYAIALGAAPPKTKAIVRKTQSSFDTTMTPPTAAGTKLSTSAKGKQPTKSSKEACNKLTYLKPVDLSSDEDDDDDVDDQSDAADDDDDQDDNDDDQDSDNDGHDDVSHDMNVRGDERPDAEDDDEELYGDVNINLEGREVQMTDVHTTQVLEDTYVTLTPVNPDGQQQITTIVVPLLVIAPTLPPPSIPIISQVQQAPAPSPATAPSTSLQDLPNFGSLFRFDHRLKTFEANFSKFMQTNQFAEPISFIPGIVDRYIDHRINEAVKVAVQLHSNRLRDEAQAENKDFLNKLDENIQKIIKEQVKVQVSKILPKIKKTVNEQLEAKVLTRASNSSKTYYVVATDLSELELKKILIEKMESNYRDDEDKDEEPSAGSDRGSKRRRTASEYAQVEDPMQTTQNLEETAHLKFKTGAADDQPLAEASQHPEWFKLTKPPTPDRDWNKTLPATHVSIQPWISDLAKKADSHTSFNELMDTPVDFLAFLMNRLKVDTLTPKLLAGPTYELMKGSCKSLYPHNLLKPLPLISNSRGRCVIPFDHFINNDLEYLRGDASSQKYTTSVTKTKAADYGHIKWIEDLVPRTMWSQAPVSYDKYALCRISHWGRKRQQFYRFAVNIESARGINSKCRIIAVTELQIVEWHNYKHLDWIIVRRDDDKLYKFKEGNFMRLRIQDIEDMLLLLVQGKLTNLTVCEHFAFNVSLRMFTRSIVIQRHVEDLQLGVESYQKKFNLTKPDTYRSDLKCKETYTAYYNLRGFIYQNKNKQNRLMRIDELHKFNDKTLNDVRTALDDRLKGIQMKYLP